MVAMYKHLFEEFRLDVISAECWTATPVMFDGLAPCALYGLLNEMGYMISCESDMHCAMTMALLRAATLGEGKPLFGEFTVRHPENRNAELLWHCGPFPVSEKAEGTKARLVNQRAWLRAKDSLDRVKAFAEKYSAEMVTTRKAVDNDILPYNLQVGLTGKTVSPPVYIAVGVSGAVHHIAGMQKSGTIIAINPDKNAPIFDYTDYGIIEKAENL